MRKHPSLELNLSTVAGVPDAMYDPATWGTVARLYTTDPERQCLTRVPFAGQTSVRVLRGEDVTCRYYDNNKPLPAGLMDGNPYFDTPRLLREAAQHPQFIAQAKKTLRETRPQTSRSERSYESRSTYASDRSYESRGKASSEAWPGALAAVEVGARAAAR
eukprot:TRINITY_DN8527_c0_g1_i3.p1 TRINITY_DN8527_c0_g1~~TRINITY_DN8527_c0_g1_i3.p1  ORF type:complete len:161 (-),score=19.17 TRINITY_DN8527_c0_g1_i3:231-713(-)